MPSKNRAGLVAIAALLLGAAGCNQSTEIPLAKVPPVTITAPPPNQALPKGMTLSPTNLNAPPPQR